MKRLSKIQWRKIQWQAGLVLCFSLVLSPLAAAQLAQAESKTEQQSVDAVVAAPVEKLQSASFEQRLAAMDSLKSLDASHIAGLGVVAEQHDSADVAARLLEVLEHFYVCESADKVAAASQALESLVDSDRQLIAESARRTLERNWKVRVELAAQELVKYGAILKRDDLLTREQRINMNRPGLWRPWQSGIRESLKVILTEKWSGGQDGIDVFNRMNALLGPQTMSHSGLSVFLIDGHTLSEEHVNTLKDLLGDTRVAPRGRVVLGITGSPQRPLGGGVGCIIEDIEPSGSADSAGLEAGDLITAIEDKPVEDFFSLVDTLKRFGVGDTVKVTVRKGYRTSLYNRLWDGNEGREIPKEVTIEVKLKGWEEFANPAPDTAEAENPPAEGEQDSEAEANPDE